MVIWIYQLFVSRFSAIYISPLHEGSPAIVSYTSQVTVFFKLVFLVKSVKSVFLPAYFYRKKKSLLLCQLHILHNYLIFLTSDN